MKKIFLVRHWEIPSNRVKRYAGWNEEELTDYGIKQAQLASEKLKDLKIGAIFTSPLKRTMQTAHIIGRALGLAPRIEPGLIEFKLGPWEGMYEKDVAAEYPEEWYTWNTNPAHLRLPGRETIAELLVRVLEAIESIRSKCLADDQKKILAVTHVAVIRVLLLHAQKKNLNFYKTIDVPNGAILDFNSGKIITAPRLS